MSVSIGVPGKAPIHMSRRARSASAAEPARTRSSLPALYRRVRVDDFQVIGDLRREIVGYAEDLGAGPEVREILALAASEALTHVLIQAYIEDEPADITVEARELRGRRLLVCITDNGHRRRPQASGPDLRGQILHQLADHVDISDSDAAAVSLQLSLEPR